MRLKNTPLCIYDKDTVYLERLSRYLMGRRDSPFLVRTYCGDDLGFLEDIKEGFLLISSSMLREEIKTLKSSRVIVLDEGDASTAYEAFVHVDKYQTAGALYELLIGECADREDVMSGEILKERAKLYCVYSPIRRIGKTQFCKKLCSEYAKDGRVLLLNFEEFSKEEGGEGLSELIYFFKTAKRHIGCELDRLVIRENDYDRLASAVHPSDLWEMSTEEMKNFLEQLLDSGSYTSVVLDLNMLMWIPDIFEISEVIYVPCTESTPEMCRVKQFEDMAGLLENNIAKKLQKVNMVLG